MAARTFANDPQIGVAAPQNPSPEAAAGAREPAEPTAANRAVGPAPDPAAGLPGQLQNLAETARDYAKASSADNTRKAYVSDWPSDREAVRNGQVRDQLRRCSTFSSRHIHVKS